MDMEALMNAMLSSDSIKTMSKKTGTSQKDVKNVLASALPALLSGAENQAKDQETAAGFVGALSDHAKDDTSDVTSFLSGVDLDDGNKIIAHLLGSKKGATAKKAAEKAGISTGQSSLILSAAGPLLMSLLGQQASTASEEENSSAGIGGLMGALLSNTDVTSLLMGLLGGGSEEETKPASSSKKKKKKKSEEDNSLLGKLIGLLK